MFYTHKTLAHYQAPPSASGAHDRHAHGLIGREL